MDHQLKRLLDLVRRTGDRLVVTDPNGEDTYVLMGLEAYEKLADSLPMVDPEPQDKPHRFDDDFLDDYYDDDYDKEEFSDKIKPEWAVPEEMPREKIDESVSKNIWEVMPPAGEVTETWNPEKFNDADKKVVEEKFEKPDFSSQPSKKDDEEPGEEQFYLEPVE
ncbi:MAG: hypothetical protein WC702_02220 [Patescibacteria group bacterium]|jgi:hypothetical protein